MKLNNVFLKAITFFLLFNVCSHCLTAQDAYHNSLVAQMQNQFGLNIGNFYISNTEAGTMGQPYNHYNQLDINATNIAANGFSKGIRVTANTNATSQPWDFQIKFKSQPIPAGQAALLTFWTRGISDETNRHGAVDVYLRYRNQATNNLDVIKRTFVTLENDWQQWFIPFETVGDTVFIGFRLGNLDQTIEFGGPALMGGFGVDVSQLPEVVRHDSYVGSGPNEQWRIDANARINQHRQSNLTVNFVDQDGDPVSGADVSIEMQSHAFSFGVAQNAIMPSEDINYRNKLINLDGNGHGLNYFTFESDFQWPNWDRPNDFGYSLSRPQLLAEVNWLKQNGFKIRGHALLWPNNRYLEVDVTNNSTAFIANEITNHISDVLLNSGVNGIIDDWDVLNEPTYNVVLEDKFGYNPVIDLYSDLFNQVENLDPSTTRILNDYVILGTGGYGVVGKARHKQIVGDIGNTASIQALGFQSHLKYPVAPERVLNILDEYNNLTDIIKINEFDVKGIDPSIQGDYVKDYLIAIFSHPKVDAFTMWGFKDNSEWNVSGTPIFDENWNLKPSGQSFVDLVFNDWWTSEQRFSDASGTTSLRAFKGGYSVSGNYNGIPFSRNFDLNADTTITIVLPVDVVGNQINCTVKTLLDGPYETTSGLMSDNLRIQDLIPATDPYLGTEQLALSLLNQTGRNAIVDWVLLEFRDTNNPSQVVSSKPALLQRDGDVVDAQTGSTAIEINALPANYYLSINHRNHLGAMSQNS